MEHFLQKIASHIHDQYGDRLEKHCMVFPNRRAGLYFMKYLSEVTGKPVWAPAVKTINELFGLSTSLKLAENETLVFELYKTYRKLNRDAENIDDFYFWGELLVNDFDDVDKYLADPDRLFENLADIRRIEEKFGGLSEEQINAVRQFWVSFNEGAKTAEKEDFLKIWSILPLLYSVFRKSLYAKGIGYEGMIFRELAERCKNGSMPAFGWNMIHFAGFNALNNCEKVLMHTLKSSGQAKFYWDYDVLYTELDTRHSAGYFLRDNLSEFGNDMPSGWQYKSNLSSGKGDAKMRIIETSSDIAQVKLIPWILRDNPELNGPESHHNAIVLADESLLVPLLSTIPGEIEEVNVTMGYPLRFSPVHSLISHLLSLQKNSYTEKNEPCFNYRDVLNIMRHNYYVSHPEIKGITLVRDLVSEKSVWISGTRFRGVPVLEMIFRRPGTPSGLSEYLKSILESNYIADEGDPRVSNHSQTEIKIRNEFIYRALLAINKLDNALLSADVVISAATWTRLLERIIRSISIPFSGEPLSGLQVMGILETRALDFRRLIILSANEGILPGISKTSSYIPYNLRKAYGLPGTEHQDSIYSYHFYRLLQRVDEITFIYNSNSEGMRTGEMSRFLLQLNYTGSKKPEPAGLGCEILTPERPSSILKRTAKHSMILDESFIKPGGKLLSPSAVNTWLHCRMKFFYKYICNISEPRKVITEIDPALFGSILHVIMQKIYASSIGKILEANDIDSLLNDIESLKKTVNETLKESWFNNPQEKTDGNVQIISNILFSYVRMILRFDCGAAPLRILALEQEIAAPLEIVLKGRKIKVNTGGFIDRLDISSDTYRIIDYKTGDIAMEIPSVKSLFNEDDDKRNEAWFQVLMYCELYSLKSNNRVRPSLYPLRNLAEKDFSDILTIGEGKGGYITIDNYSAIREDYASDLQRTLIAIFDENENFKMTEHYRKCEYCTYRQLCSR